MNAVIENILTRRSVRSYLDKQVEKGSVELIVKAGRYAPSAMNGQTFQITVVRNPEILKDMYTAIPKYMGTGGEYNFYGAKTLILVSDKKDKEIGQMDCACVAENMFLAAHSLGIGSVWINQFRETSDCEDVRAALNKAGVPAEHKVWVAVALGYPVSKPEDKEKTAAVHWCE